MNKLSHYFFTLIITSFLQNSWSDDFRIFHDSTGREIEACLRSYTPNTSRVKVELKNKSVKSVNISIFSDSDQAFIREWHLAKTLLSGSKIMVSANKKTVKSEEIFRCEGGWDGYDPGLRCKEIAYDIELENRSGTALNNLRVEYCIYKESTIDETKRVIELRPEINGTVTLSSDELPRKVEITTITDRLSIATLPHKEKFSIAPKTLKLLKGRRGKRNKELTEGTTQDIDEEIQGIRIRLHIPMKSGEEVMREFSFPSDLVKKTEWHPSE